MSLALVTHEGVPVDDRRTLPHVEVGTTYEATPHEELCQVAAKEAAKQSTPLPERKP